MRRPSPKKMTSKENEKIRTTRSRNIKLNQENTYAKLYPKPKEGRAERVTRRAALAGQVQDITSAWMILTPWVSMQKKVFNKNEHRLRRHHNKSGRAEGTRTKECGQVTPERGNVARVRLDTLPPKGGR